MLGGTLKINAGTFSLEELQAAIKKMKNKKAAGPDDVPAEFWNVVCGDEHVCATLLRVCQTCWETKNTPSTWRRANVALLFKKGDATLPSNYRPISLLAVGYQALASMLHQRLSD
eukprot:8929458-Pyramimonas_sp.AAC.1